MLFHEVDGDSVDVRFVYSLENLGLEQRITVFLSPGSLFDGEGMLIGMCSFWLVSISSASNDSFRSSLTRLSSAKYLL